MPSANFNPPSRSGVQASFSPSSSSGVDISVDVKVTDHTKLTNRDVADQHPMSAITGLEDALNGKQPSGDYATNEQLQAEATARSAADSKLAEDLNVESTRASAAENSLGEQIGNEVNERVKSDNELSSAIGEKQDKLPYGDVGTYLKKTDTGLEWATVDALPSQEGHGGQSLTTNGTTASWTNTILVRDWGD